MENIRYIYIKVMCCPISVIKSIFVYIYIFFITGIAIFCMLLTYYMWIKAVKTGTLFWSTMASLAYFYMVSFS